MDGNLVRISVLDPVIKVAQIYPEIFGAHLMIEHPERYIHNFKLIGVDILTVHYETQNHLKSYSRFDKKNWDESRYCS